MPDLPLPQQFLNTLFILLQQAFCLLTVEIARVRILHYIIPEENT